MPEPYRPARAKLYKRQNKIFIPAWAGYTAGTGPTVAEMTGASILDLTRVMFADSPLDPTMNTELVDEPANFGDDDIYQMVGRTTWGGGSFTYMLSPQAATGSDGKKAWEKFLNSTGPVTGFLIDRMDVFRSTDVAAGQFVDGYPIEVGPSKPTKVGQGAGAVAGAMAFFAVTAAPRLNVAVAS